MCSVLYDELAFALSSDESFNHYMFVGLHLFIYLFIYLSRYFKCYLFDTK